MPDHMKDAMKNYLEHGISPGGFLTAVLCNDLKEAVGRADSTNLAALPNIVSYCYNEIPSTSWGSPEKFEAWLNSFKDKKDE